MVLILKARRFHQQALSSKALLSIYMYALKQNKARDFLQKNVFRKFFKQKWLPQYERVKALRVLMKKMVKKEQEWDRTRY